MLYVVDNVNEQQKEYVWWVKHAGLVSKKPKNDTPTIYVWLCVYYLGQSFVLDFFFLYLIFTDRP